MGQLLDYEPFSERRKDRLHLTEHPNASSRYWKNRYEASKDAGEFTPTQLAEMRKGNSPMDYNPRTDQWERRELRHVDPQRNVIDNGPLNLRELTPDWHAEVDPFRRVPGIKPTRGIQ
jgi:hypothetical protein